MHNFEIDSCSDVIMNSVNRLSDKEFIKVVAGDERCEVDLFKMYQSISLSIDFYTSLEYFSELSKNSDKDRTPG
jgi:hypothetical protein